MEKLVRCPRCGKVQVSSSHAFSENGSSRVPTSGDPRLFLQSLTVLLLALTIFGLPIADWLCRRYEAEAARNCPSEETRSSVVSFCRCRQCGHAWMPNPTRPLTQGIS